MIALEQVTEEQTKAEKHHKWNVLPEIGENNTRHFFEDVMLLDMWS